LKESPLWAKVLKFSLLNLPGPFGLFYHANPFDVGFEILGLD